MLFTCIGKTKDMSAVALNKIDFRWDLVHYCHVYTTNCIVYISDKCFFTKLSTNCIQYIFNINWKYMVYPPMASTYQRVLSGRRVSLPESLVKKFGIKEGDIVIVEEDRDSIRIMPAEIVRRKA